MIVILVCDRAKNMHLVCNGCSIFIVFYSNFHTQLEESNRMKTQIFFIN